MHKLLEFVHNFLSLLLPAPHRCKKCGKPAIGLGAEINGRLPYRDRQGKKIGTQLYVGAPDWYCREHLDQIIE